MLVLVAAVSGVVIVMAMFLIILHCRRLEVRTHKTLSIHEKSEHEIWPDSGGENKVS